MIGMQSSNHIRGKGRQEEESWDCVAGKLEIECKGKIGQRLTMEGESQSLGFLSRLFLINTNIF